MDELEKLSQEVKKLNAKFGIHNKQDFKNFCKSVFAELEQEQSKMPIFAIQQAEFNAYLVSQAIAIQSQRLIEHGETLVVDWIKKAYTVKSWSRKHDVFTFYVEEIDQPISIFPKETIL